MSEEEKKSTDKQDSYAFCANSEPFPLVIPKGFNEVPDEGLDSEIMVGFRPQKSFQGKSDKPENAVMSGP